MLLMYFCTSDAPDVQTLFMSEGSLWVLTAAIRHAGGVATATCAATAKRPKTVAILANMMRVVFEKKGVRETGILYFARDYGM